MPRGTIDWKATESYTRLLAALVASQDLKLNYKKIADYYGEGATYDAIEGRFRIIRKDAEKLKAELDNGEREPAPNRGTKSANSTPRKPRPSKDGSSSASLHSTTSGRVTKSTNSSPSKPRSAAAKQRLAESVSTSAGSASGGNATSTTEEVDILDVGEDGLA